MTTIRGLLAGIALVAALVVGALGGGEAAASEAQPLRLPPSEEGESGERCPGGSHEGCYGFDEMDVYLGEIIGLVSPLFVERYGADSQPAAVVYVESGQAGETECGYYDSSAFYYCPLTESIVIGQDELWHFYNEAGDAAPALALAHEWGHHVQTLMGVPRGTAAVEWITFENQADCVSGAWLRYADAQEILEYPDDTEDIERILQLVAAAEDDPARQHGTLQERTEAVELGFTEDLAGCDTYFPDTPVSPQ